MEQAIGTPTMTPDELVAWQERMRGGKHAQVEAAGVSQAPAVRAGAVDADGPLQRCTHRWRIEEQNGTSRVGGACGKCGALRTFRASEEPTDWAINGAGGSKVAS